MDLFRLVVIWLGDASILTAATSTSVLDSLLASKLEISGLSILSPEDSSDVIVRPLPMLKIAARIKATYDKNNMINSVVIVRSNPLVVKKLMM